MCEIRKRGNHPTKTPAVLTPGWEDGPHFAARPAPKCSRAAGPLDVTAPSHPLLNFKPRVQEHPGGGGFLRSRRLSHARGRHLPAPSVPCAPEGPALALPRRGPKPTGAPGERAGAGAGHGRGTGTGGAGRGPLRAEARAPVARRSAPAPARGKRRWGVYVSRGKSPPRRAVRLSGRPALSCSSAPPPGSCSRDGQRRVTGARELSGWEGVSRKPRGGREGGRGGPGGGQGDWGSRRQRSLGRLTNGLIDCSGFGSGRSERGGAVSWAMASGECSRRGLPRAGREPGPDGGGGGGERPRVLPLRVSGAQFWLWLILSLKSPLANCQPFKKVSWFRVCVRNQSHAL